MNNFELNPSENLGRHNGKILVPGKAQTKENGTTNHPSGGLFIKAKSNKMQKVFHLNKKPVATIIKVK